jgi:hypothetical protein
MEFAGFHTPRYQTVHWADYTSKDLVSNEMRKREFRENYTPMTFNTDQNAVEENVATIHQMHTDLNKTSGELQKNYKSLTRVVNRNINARKYLQKNNSKYHYDDTQDPNVILRPEESKDIKVAIQQDIQHMKLYQNSIYMVSAIAGATLLIATIILVKPSK